MVQKQSHRTTTSDRGCGAARSFSAYRSGSLRRCALYRATMVSTCSGAKAESCRLERSFLGSPSNATYEGFPRAGGVDHPSSAEGPQPAGRVWRCGHSTRNGNPRDRAVALDFHDRPDSAASWCPGWPPTSSSSIAATRLVSSRGCSGKGRIGQFRHDRRSGNSWWAPCGRFDGNIAAWRSARNLDRPGRQRQDGGERPGGTLAFGRASRLRAVRQRQSVSRSSAVRRHRGTRDPVVLEPGRNACLCAAERDRFSGGHRELQRPVASQGLVAIHTRFDPRPEPAIGQVHRGGAKAQQRPYRSLAAPSAVSKTLASGPATCSARNDRLLATYRRPRSGQPSRSCVCGRSTLAAPPRSCGGQFGRQHYPLLCLATPRANRSATLEQGVLHPAKTSLPRVTLTY